MGLPKPKSPTARRPRRVRHVAHVPTAAEREAAEDRADVEAYDRAMADRAARGNPPGIPWEQVKREIDLLK